MHSLRRYAWNARQLLQELRQNNFGVMPSGTGKMMTSVERNAENMVEVANAYMEQCQGIESFYDSFQEKLQASTLYILTIATVVIMPYQIMTGLFGMNFVDVNPDHIDAATGEASPEYGLPNMPLLTWKHGYLFFWLIGGVLTLVRSGTPPILGPGYAPTALRTANRNAARSCPGRRPHPPHEGYPPCPLDVLDRNHRQALYGCRTETVCKYDPRAGARKPMQHPQHPLVEADCGGRGWAAGRTSCGSSGAVTRSTAEQARMVCFSSRMQAPQLARPIRREFRS